MFSLSWFLPFSPLSRGFLYFFRPLFAWAYEFSFFFSFFGFGFWLMLILYILCSRDFINSIEKVKVRDCGNNLAFRWIIIFFNFFIFYFFLCCLSSFFVEECNGLMDFYIDILQVRLDSFCHWETRGKYNILDLVIKRLKLQYTLKWWIGYFKID